MNVIKNRHLLANKISLMDLEKLETGAQLFLRHSRIEFKILDTKDGVLTIRTTQSKSPADNYLSQADLIIRTKDLFTPFFNGWEIHAHAIPYEPSPVDEVDVKWIKAMMSEYNMGLKGIVKYSGIDKASLSAILNGHVNLSQPMKGMFYYFFLWYATTPEGLVTKISSSDADN